MVLKAYILASDPAWIEPSVGSYYDVVDEIVVSYDRSSRGWTGAPIPVEECLDRLRGVDRDKKMRLTPGDFARAGHSPMENDTYQRQCALEAAGRGADWVLCVDTDEVIPDARGFARRLVEEVPKDRLCVEWPMRPFFQRTASGKFLEVCSYLRTQFSEYPGCVTVRPGVTLHCSRAPVRPAWRFGVSASGYDPVQRRRYRADGRVAKGEAILHFTWVRTEAQMRTKLGSWSHNRDFDGNRYYEDVWLAAPDRWLWLYDFHPVNPKCWPALRPVRLPGSLTGERQDTLA